ncbi:MAG: DNA/RNA nuclease SfsA [Thermoplasmata archaeon]|nr:DNA/RNA nuclease SfsA [Thermoplasmata archaeon]
MNHPILTVKHDAKGIFKERPNRFLGIVDIIKGTKNKSHSEQVHIHDPGRLRELLYPGNQILLKRASNTERKTRWDIIAARADEQWVLIHSGYHRAITENILQDKSICPFGKLNSIKAEVPFGNSRLDFLITTMNGTKILVEVKGCTLTRDGVALFPDAPTERGTRHLETLLEAKANGYSTALIVLVFRQDSICFMPNTNTDPKFASMFKTAVLSGLEVYPLMLSYDGEMIYYEKIIPVCQEKE